MWRRITQQYHIHRLAFASNSEASGERDEYGHKEQGLIYRITAECVVPVSDPDSDQTRYDRAGGGMRGLFRAGFGSGWGDLALVWIENPKARFYFTEKGWEVYGKRVAAHAGQHGVTLRVCREKRPDRSRILYEDEFQIVLLPNRTRPDRGG